MAQIVSQSDRYRTGMTQGYVCQANGSYAAAPTSTCYRMDQTEIDGTTVANGAETLLEPAVAGTDSGSFGPLANTTGFVSIELTDMHQADSNLPGNPQGAALDVTLTTTANVRPIVPPGADPCVASVPAVTVKKVLRAHAIIPGDGSSK